MHNPEFTIVEWYRAGDTYDGAMGLLAELVQELLGAESVERRSYREAFLRHVGADPHRAALEELSRAATARGLAPLAASTACAVPRMSLYRLTAGMCMPPVPVKARSLSSPVMLLPACLLLSNFSKTVLTVPTVSGVSGAWIFLLMA